MKLFMIVFLKAVLIFALCLAVVFCSSVPDSEPEAASEIAESQPEPEEAPAQAQESDGAEEVTSTEAESALPANPQEPQEDAPDNALEDTPEDALEDTVNEPEEETAVPIIVPSIQSIAHSPGNPFVGDLITLKTVTANAEEIQYDFGSGPSREATIVYETFGVKTVVATARRENRQQSEVYLFTVYGQGTVSVAHTAVEHNAEGTPVTQATIIANGVFESIKAYYENLVVFEGSKQEVYEIPIPFVGEYTFQIGAFVNDKPVADLGDITITGLNTPPDPPRFEGPAFVSSTAGEPTSFSVFSSDPNRDPIRYEVSFAPAGASFDETTGEFSWTPAADQRGLHIMHFRAYDVPYDTKRSFTQRGINVE